MRIDASWYVVILAVFALVAVGPVKPVEGAPAPYSVIDANTALYLGFTLTALDVLQARAGYELPKYLQVRLQPRVERIRMLAALCLLGKRNELIDPVICEKTPPIPEFSRPPA